MQNDGATVTLNLNNADFQQGLFALGKDERNKAIETLRKISKMRWDQIYADNGLKWEKITTATPPKGASVVYTLRISRSRRATAYRDGTTMCFLSIAPDHDATYGRK